MKTNLLLSAIIIFFNSVLLPQWIQQTSPITSGTLKDVKFINTTTGWVVGGNNVLKTTDGGATWVAQTSGMNSIESVFFVNSTTGWIVGSSGKIMKSTDGGVTWTAQTSGTTETLKCVFFVSENTGWAVGWGGVILKTTNGGTNWNAQNSGTTNMMAVVFFIDANTGWAGGGSKYRRTTDGGATWTNINQFAELRDIQFLDANNGFAVETYGQSNHVLKTTDGGLTWQTGPTITTGPYYRHSIFFTDVNTGYAAGYSFSLVSVFGIYKTTDGGTTWTGQTLSPDFMGRSFYSIYFVDANTGWAVGEEARIYKTTNGGVTFVGEENGSLPNEFSLEQNYPNPFNPSTRISWHSPVSGHQTLKIFDMLGNEVATLVDEYREAGSYGVEFNSVKTLRTSASLSNRATSLPSGIYFYKLRAGNFSETKKMILTK